MLFYLNAEIINRDISSLVGWYMYNLIARTAYNVYRLVCRVSDAAGGHRNARRVVTLTRL